MTAGCLRPSASLLPQPVTSGLTEQGKVCNRYSLSSHLPHSGRKNAFSCRQCFGPRQRLRVISYAEYDRGAPQYRSRFGSTTPTGVTSAVQSVSFNQQLLLVLSIPALALGLPLVLGHPIIFVVIPFVVYKTPALNSLVEPLLTPVLQSILSGLRPSGSPRSEGFPWQQQTRQSSWSSSPPIDVEYRSLPADSTTDQYTQTDTSTGTPSASQTQAPSATGSEKFTTYEQPSTSYASTQTYTPNRQAAPTGGPSRQQAMFDTSSRQRVRFDRQQGASMSDSTRSRRKVSINPTNRRSMVNGRIVRQATPDQVGVNVGPESPVTAEPNSNLVRALLGVFPFLRHWGGFL